MACPACRRQFDASFRFCPHDARRLVAAAELAARPRPPGALCPRCRRAYEPGIKFCPHHADELIPIPVWEATRGKAKTQSPTGVLAKICPTCQGRHDLASTFCSRDGAELVTVN